MPTRRRRDGQSQLGKHLRRVFVGPDGGQIDTWHTYHVLKELGGWETLEMVNRYAHLAPEHLKAHAERLSLTAQIRHNGDAPEKSEVAVSS